MSLYLSGDIGGTKTRLAVVEVSDKLVRIIKEISYPSRDFATFEELVGDFLSRSHTTTTGSVTSPGIVHEKTFVSFAAFGIAGPVLGSLALTTNLPWRIDANALKVRFGFSECILLNDLEATAYGISALEEQDLMTLQKGSEGTVGNMAVIAAGTGLGEAGLYWDGEHHRPFATEGGHSSFSPDNEMDMAFLVYMQKKHRHVSWERVVSGMGLLSLHDFLRLYRKVPTPSWLVEEMRSADAAAIISNAAQTGQDDICIEIMHWFVRLYGAETGNLALKVMSHGGVYLGGGIAPKIIPLLQNEMFLNAFLNKGRMRNLLEAMPVRIILNDRAALFGPALRAAQQDNS